MNIEQLQKKLIETYSGSVDDLEMALSIIAIGHFFGWRVLYLIHNKKLLRRFQETTGYSIRDVFPECGEYAMRSAGYLEALQTGNYWKCVSGDNPLQFRRVIR